MAKYIFSWGFISEIEAIAYNTAARINPIPIVGNAGSPVTLYGFGGLASKNLTAAAGVKLIVGS